MRRWFALAATVMLFAASCGEGGSDSAGAAGQPEATETPGSGDGNSSPSAALSDPCSLIDDQEASDLLPNPVAGNVLGPGLCDYAPVDLTVGRVDVEVFVQDMGGAGCDLYFSVGGFGDAEPFDGIGTAARWKGDSGSNINQLGVCIDGEMTLTITLYDPDHTADARATARALGELVISRL